MDRVFVVQIGSNDGKSGDPLYSLLVRNTSWEALFVEPVPFLFERLRKNYGTNRRFRFENVAIAEQVGVRKFYYINDTAKKHLLGLPCWFDQLGSFDRSHISRHFGTALDEFIVCEDIPTLPLATLFEHNRVNRIDLLHIDTEGYDWAILQQLDLRKYTPTAILFEHNHLSEEAKEEACAFLHGRYSITRLGEDFFCLRVSPV